MTKRVLAGTIIVAAFLLLLAAGLAFETDAFLFILLVAAVPATLLEFYRLCEFKGLRPFTAFGVMSSAAFTALAYAETSAPRGLGAAAGGALLPLELCFLAFGCVLLQSFRGGFGGAIEDIGATVLGVIYVWLPATFLLRIQHIGGENSPETGPMLVFYAVMATKAADIGAYVIGSTVGRHKLCPRISPKKTVEGFIGGMAMSVAAAAALKLLVFTEDEFLDWPALVAVTLAIGVAGMLGDLAESLLKRAAGVKDSSSRVPGLGGLLDVEDSLLASLPVAYCLLALAK